jgi:hypothetical protein
MCSPRRSWLYRSRTIPVISRLLFFCLVLGPVATRLQAQGPIVQYGQKVKVDKGPRAVGLIQLPAKGKPRLIPVAIMVDGKFYDADSYKAAPVPMAVDFGIVYEAFQAGVSQGIFTITQPGQLDHTWIAEGKWLSASMRAAEEKKRKKFAPPVIEDENGPPVLHRRKTADSESKGKDKNRDEGKDQSKDDGASKDKSTASNDKSTTPDQKQPPENQKEEQKPATTTPASTSDAGKTTASPASAGPPVTKKVANESESSSSPDEPPADPNRPRLRRGAPPDPSVRRDVYAKFEPLPAPVAKSPGIQKTGAVDSPAIQVTTFPAVSDASGPDPMPYLYDVKPSEEETYRAKMLELAGAQLRGPSLAAKQAKASGQKSSSAKASKAAGKLPKVEFDDVSLRIFDLSNSNEPVLVLSAKARMVAAGASDAAVEPKEITLIARTNLEGELKKLFFSQTDSRHLDETPRMEIVDAVDADGDGRGELLFRRIFDNGSAYGIYRVSSDKLWPLFEGTP